ncbi:hypothetical protein BK671_14260 [Pseudomonas fluorescens]|uniref:Uncharacterized protein n=1 Tax=Pseudomonas fluorescens TaxID=294 RepID=A0A423LIG3_PSEFL|nr:hypothetical protein BK671_14260 [Pseudomonas fluorescens]
MDSPAVCRKFPIDLQGGRSKDRRLRQLLQGFVSTGVGRLAKNRDLAVIFREMVNILFQQRQIVVLSPESLTLRRPFIFLLRLCA